MSYCKSSINKLTGRGVVQTLGRKCEIVIASGVGSDYLKVILRPLTPRKFAPLKLVEVKRALNRTARANDERAQFALEKLL